MDNKEAYLGKGCLSIVSAENLRTFPLLGFL